MVLSVVQYLSCQILSRLHLELHGLNASDLEDVCTCSWQIRLRKYHAFILLELKVVISSPICHVRYISSSSPDNHSATICVPNSHHKDPEEPGNPSLWYSEVI